MAQSSWSPNGATYVIMDGNSTTELMTLRTELER